MRLGGPQSRSGRYGEVKIFYPTGTRTPSSPIPTELSRLLTFLSIVCMWSSPCINSFILLVATWDSEILADMELLSAEIWKVVFCIYPEGMSFIQILTLLTSLYSLVGLPLHLSVDRCDIYSHSKVMSISLLAVNSSYSLSPLLSIYSLANGFSCSFLTGK
jgi:hypothetical protein